MKNRRDLCAAVLTGFAAICVSLSANASVPISATYNGLFFETNGVWQQSSGLITISTTAAASTAPRCGLAGANIPTRVGWCPMAWPSSAPSKRPSRMAIGFRSRFRSTLKYPDLITGVVSNLNWTASFSAYGEVFDGVHNLCPYAGLYTMILPGDYSSTSSPGGDSYGRIYVNKAGRLTFSGFLADGYSVSQATTVSADGQWPFYLPLYSGDGSMFAWLSLGAPTNAAISGNVAWIKPRMYWQWYYPGGFTNSVAVLGSHYEPPRGRPVLNFSNGLLDFNGGQLRQSITDQVLLTPDSHLEDLGTGTLRFSVQPATLLSQPLERSFQRASLGLPFRGLDRIQGRGAAGL